MAKTKKKVILKKRGIQVPEGLDRHQRFIVDLMQVLRVDRTSTLAYASYGEKMDTEEGLAAAEQAALEVAFHISEDRIKTRQCLSDVLDRIRDHWPDDLDDGDEHAKDCPSHPDNQE